MHPAVRPQPSFASTEVLEIAFEQSGPADGTPVILLHGFPYDTRAYDEVAPMLVARGARVIVPSLRGYGATSFRDPATPRSGQQAALGRDVIDLMDALDIGTAVVAGFDWGGRAACVAAAVWPERISGLVTADGYTIQNIASFAEPAAPEHERAEWHQFYLLSERGRRGLEANRRDLCELLWRSWSPAWRFTTDDFLRSAPSFDNPEFVDVVVHSYRHRFGLAQGDPRYDAIEATLATQPPISVPTIVCAPGNDGFPGDEEDDGPSHFTGRFEKRVIETAGHNVPQQCPADFADAVAAVLVGSTT